MKESIQRYIASHASTEVNLPDGWVKTTYKQDKPTIMGQRMDVCIYSHKELGVDFYLSTEEDQLNIECHFSDEVLSYAEAEELEKCLQRSIDNVEFKIEIRDKLPPVNTYTSMTHIIINEGNNDYTYFIAIPDTGFYLDHIRSSDGVDQKFCLMQIVRALKEKNLEQIEKFKDKHATFLPDIYWNLTKDGILSSYNEAYSVGLIKEAVALIQEKCPTFPKEIFQDMGQFIARQQKYYTSRRHDLLAAINSDPLRWSEHFFDIIQGSKKLTSNQLYTRDYINVLAKWYWFHEHYNAYICIFKAMQLAVKTEYTADFAKMMRDYETHIFLLSKRVLPPAVRLKLLPFLCEFVISQAIANPSDKKLKLHAIELLNELSGGEHFRIPYDDDFEEEYGSPSIVQLAKTFGDIRRNVRAECMLATNDQAKDLLQTGTVNGVNFSNPQQPSKQKKVPEPAEIKLNCSTQ